MAKTPKIKITDQFGVDIITGTAGPASGIAKYFKGDIAGFIASADLALAIPKRLDRVPAGTLGLGMTFAADGTFGSTGVDWSFTAGAKLTVRATQGGKAVPADAVFDPAHRVPEDQTFLTLTFTPTLTAGITTGVADLQFGFTAGGSVAFASGRGYAGEPPTLAAAIQDLLETAVVPGNALDVRAMREGDYGSVAGSGRLGFSASFDVARVFNPLALPNLPLKQGAVGLKAGASLSVGASVEMTGQYQVRVVKLGGQKARVGIYRMTGSQFEFTVDASAGLAFNFGKHELLAKVMGLLGSIESDEQNLQDAGLSQDQIDTFAEAIAASVNRSIAVSLSGGFASSSEKSCVAEYEFDLDLLGSEGLDALNRALRADFSPLATRKSTELPQGVRMLTSQIEEVRKKSVTWKLNLFGLVNHLNVRELVRRSTALFNADTGELVVTDSVTASEIAVTTHPLAADTQKLQKLMMKSLVITAAYHASALQGLSSELKGSMSYFAQTANANGATIRDYLDNLSGLGLITDDERAAFLKNKFGGRASLFLDATFDQACFGRMFFDKEKARTEETYDDIGRAAIAAIIRQGDEQEFRRVPMLDTDESRKTWRLMSEAGHAAAFKPFFPRADALTLQMLGHDFTVIKWWSAAMSKAAKEALAMRKFMKDNTKSPEELETDEEFRERREKLNKALAKVADRSLPDFVDAWGMLALDAAAKNKASLRGVVLTMGPVLVAKR